MSGFIEVDMRNTSMMRSVNVATQEKVRDGAIVVRMLWGQNLALVFAVGEDVSRDDLEKVVSWVTFGVRLVSSAIYHQA